MSWKKILNKAKDIALPTIGFALGGPAGAALGGGIAGSVGHGRFDAKRALMGAGSGYLGGRLGSAAGLQGNKGFGELGGSVRNLFTAKGASAAASNLGGLIGEGGNFFDKYGNIIGQGANAYLGMREGDRASKESAYEREVREREFAQNFAQRQAEFERKMALEEAEALRRREEDEYQRRLGDNRANRVNEYMNPFLAAMGNRA
jgi:hypothetical protein